MDESMKTETGPRTSRPPGRWLIWAALYGLAACGGDAPQGAGGPPGGGGPPAGMGPGGAPGRAIPVSGRVVQSGDLEVTLRSSTNLRAREEVQVVPRQVGLIDRILVEEGARVSEGQVLAQLDDREWRLQAEQAEARSQAAQDAVARARALRELDLISDQEVERLASEVRVTEAEVGLARLRVANAQIRAPIAGTVTHRYVERGQQVNTQNPAFGLADLERLEAQLAVPERESARVAVGQTARILLQEGSAAVAAGTVERIRPVVDAASGTVQVTVMVASRAGEFALRPGQFVNVDVVTETLTDRVTLPRTAVLVDGAVPRVYVLQDGVALEREVTLGFSRGDQVEIRTGITPGDTVIVVGQDNLRDRAPVRLMELDGRPVQSTEAQAPEGFQPPAEGRGRPEGGGRPQGNGGNGPGDRRPPQGGGGR
jgi:membrane fusion protein, multidrug efflux system